jgi:hypothetical protein
VPNTRDAHGRYLKGTTGNPKGRPTKLSKVDFGDFLRFKNSILEIDTAAGKKILTREAAIQERLYASAMKGNVQAQIFLSRKFEQYKENEAEIEARFHGLRESIKRRGTPATEAEMEMISLGAVVLGYVERPGVKVKPTRSRAKGKTTPTNDPPSPQQKPSWESPPTKPAKPSK